MVQELTKTNKHRIRIVFAAIPLAYVLAAGCTSASRQGIPLGHGKSVGFEALGNYAFDRGRIELYFRPEWDSHSHAERILFRTGSNHLKTQIGFRGGRHAGRR
jgi:hypothetical protein